MLDRTRAVYYNVEVPAQQQFVLLYRVFVCIQGSGEDQLPLRNFKNIVAHKTGNSDLESCRLYGDPNFSKIDFSSKW